MKFIGNYRYTEAIPTAIRGKWFNPPRTVELEARALVNRTVIGIEDPPLVKIWTYET